MHYRHAGEGNPGRALLILHASPGSSRQQVRTIEDFAGERRVYAPDTPGNGDSPALFDREPTMPELATAMLGFLDAMGLDRVDVYGSHTGASIAAELAILAPERIGALVLDGVSLMEGEQLDEVLSTYAFPFEPDLDGAYLLRMFMFCRDQYLFFPWYKRTREGRRENGLGSAQDLHAWMLEVMKASTTYQRNYHASFKWRADTRLPLVTVPTLVTAAVNDPLRAVSETLCAAMPTGTFCELPRLDAPDFRAARHAAITGFTA
ncbi:alpha/beta hydrolase [Novosphingobium profundi]|nr:alpha/beta hydrolase [Novosphingobium profundi]MBT0669239.1 alpha/beta hydrolase [Novosphingobium profundi]